MTSSILIVGTLLYLIRGSTGFQTLRVSRQVKCNGIGALEMKDSWRGFVGTGTISLALLIGGSSGVLGIGEDVTYKLVSILFFFHLGFSQLAFLYLPPHLIDLHDPY